MSHAWWGGVPGFLVALLLVPLQSSCGGGSSAPTGPADPFSVTVGLVVDALVVGDSTQASATVRDASGNVLTGRSVSWHSADPAVATVGAGGMVRGVGVGGPVAITASAGEASGDASVRVVLVSVASVSVALAAPTVHAGAQVQATASVRDAAGRLLSGRAVTWSSSAPDTASVSGTGLVTGQRGGGPVTIRATVEGVEGSAELEVKVPDLLTCLAQVPVIEPGCRLTRDPLLQRNPSVSGSRVVWEERSDDGRSALMVMDLETGASRVLTPPGTDNLYPVLDGDLVLFRRGNDTVGTSLHVHDLRTDQERRIHEAPPGRLVIGGTISAARVVWVEEAVGDSEVFVYDLVADTLGQLTEDGWNQMSVSVIGDTVTWMELSTRGPIHASELGSGATWQIPVGTGIGGSPWAGRDKVVWNDSRDGNTPYWAPLDGSAGGAPIADSRIQLFPAISTSGRHVAWAALKDGGTRVDWDIVLYDFLTGRLTRLTQHPSRERNPTLSDTFVAWEDSRDEGQRIFVMRLDRVP